MSTATFTVDDYDLPNFTELASRFGQTTFSFVVTPNADHMIRLDEDAEFRKSYADAGFVLFDSHFLSNVLRLTRGFHVPVCTGSDLTERLFSSIINPDDPIVLIGCTAKQAMALASRYGLRRLAHFSPPMGFIHDAASVERALRFVEAHSPFRFCFLAVGAPQQEFLARQLKARVVARGLALCIGASINFLTGAEHRAPLWMQRMGMEWLFRLAQAPGRMAERYLVRCPRVFKLLRTTTIMLRAPAFRPYPFAPGLSIPQQPVLLLT